MGCKSVFHIAVELISRMSRFLKTSHDTSTSLVVDMTLHEKVTIIVEAKQVNSRLSVLA